MIPASYKPKKRFMQLAITEAKRARDRGDYPIGAVITRLTGRREVVIASAGNRVKTSGQASSTWSWKCSSMYRAAMAATCPTSCSTPRMSPVPCAPAPVCGRELARSSTVSPKKTLPLMAASAVRKTTSGELASSPAGSSSRRAITASLSSVVFSDKNANNCSVTGLHSGLLMSVTRK
jgi:hypothetical protein